MLNIRGAFEERDDHEESLIDFSYAIQVITEIYTFSIFNYLAPTNNYLILVLTLSQGVYCS